MKERMYVGFAASHKGHRGISAAKLLHVVVCFRDFFEGPGNWRWNDKMWINHDQMQIKDVDNTMFSETPMVPGIK